MLGAFPHLRDDDLALEVDDDAALRTTTIHVGYFGGVRAVSLFERPIFVDEEQSVGRRCTEVSQRVEHHLCTLASVVVGFLEEICGRARVFGVSFAAIDIEHDQRIIGKFFQYRIVRNPVAQIRWSEPASGNQDDEFFTDEVG